MTKLSPEAQALLNAGRDALSPTRATKESVLRSIDASLASGTAAAGSGLFAASKLWLALTLVAGIGGGWFLFRDTPGQTADESAMVATAPQPAVVQPAEPVKSTGPAELAANELAANAGAANAVAANALAANEVAANELAANEVAANDVAANELAANEAPANELAANELAATELAANAELATAKPAPRNPTVREAAAQRPKAADPLAEQRLLASAQRAIRDKNYSKARSLLSEHEKSFQDGLLAPERQAARAMVNCLEPTGTNGKAIARRFLERHASSPLAARVRSTCKLEE
jgi:hypothetical protein